MVEAQNILIVEGDADKSLFEKICRKIELETSVKVAVSKDLGGTHNSKEGVLKTLRDFLPLLQSADKVTRIAVVVDADYSAHHGLGYERTIEKITSIVQIAGFERDNENQAGIIFNNPDSSGSFGLWVMPDNQNEGMLEDWIKNCIVDTELTLFQQATNTLQQLTNRKFPDHLLSKAEVATWLAWQKKPGHGIYSVIKDDLLDLEHPLFKELERWLIKVFTDLPEQ
jgi:hypothetical protein